VTHRLYTFKVYIRQKLI